MQQVRQQYGLHRRQARVELLVKLTRVVGIVLVLTRVILTQRKLTQGHEIEYKETPVIFGKLFCRGSTGTRVQICPLSDFGYKMGKELKKFKRI